METLMSKATTKPLDVFEKLSATFGGPEYVQALLSFTVSCLTIMYAIPCNILLCIL